MKSLETLLHFLLLALIFIMPCQWGFPFPPTGKAILYVSGADILLGIAFLVWLALVALSRGWKQVRLPPIPLLAFTGLALLSCLYAQERKMAVKEAVQTLELFLVAGLVFANGFRTARDWHRARLVLAASTTLILLLALIQYFTEPHAFRVRGSFDDKNALATYLALVLPFFLGCALGETQTASRWWWGLLILPGLYVTLSLPALAVIFAAALLVLAVHSPKALAMGCAAALLLLAWGPRLLLRPGHSETLGVSVAFFVRGNAAYTPQGASQQVGVILEEAGYDAARDFLSVYEDLYPGHPGLEPGRKRLQAYLDGKNRELPEEERWSLDLTTQPRPLPNSRYVRWHAACQMARSNRAWGLVGVGAGNFQKSVNEHYEAGGPLRKPDPQNRGGAADTFGLTSNEPNSFNQYLVLAGELGIPGLLVYLWMVMEGCGRALSSLGAKAASDGDRGVALGSLAALLSALAIGLFHPLIVRGVGLTLLFLLSASRHSSEATAGSP